VTLELVPVTLKQANRFLVAHHEHNEDVRGWRFGAGIEIDGVLVAVAVAGRATGRGIDQYRDVEVTRVCVAEKGVHKNACSRLYGAVCRAAAALGYRRAWTYTLDGEDAASVRAAGFVLDEELAARPTWDTPSRPRERQMTMLEPRKRPAGAKRRWRRDLVNA
jgi:hypothetical protein